MQNHSKTNLPFLKGGGEMGELTRSYNWSDNLLGEPEHWPQSLKTTLSILLNSRFPMFLWWGPELICFYNDAYRPSLGQNGKHPSILGMPAKEAWPEIWDIIKPLIDGVLNNGEATWNEDLLVPIFRNGRIEDVYWTFSYSPVTDESGKPAGVLVTCNETTSKIIIHRQLEESEERFRNMAESSDILIAVGDETGNATYFSKAWVELTGRSMKKLLEFGWADLLHPEDREQYVNIYLDAFKHHIPFTGEFRILSKNGGYHWLLAKGTPRFHHDGTFTGYISSCVEITERKYAEQEKINLLTAVSEKQQRLDQIIDEIPTHVLVLEGPDLIIQTINEAVLSYWLKERRDVVGKRLLEVLPELNDQPFPLQLREVLETGVTISHKETLVVFETAQGDKVDTYVDYTYQPLTNINNSRIGILVTSFEVTDRVRSRQLLEKYTVELQTINEEMAASNEEMLTTNEELEQTEKHLQRMVEELAASESRFRFLVQGAPVAIAVLSGREMLVETANDMILKAWGKTSAIVGLPLAIAIPELEGQPFLQLLNSVYDSGEPHYGYEAATYIMHEGKLQEFYYDFIYQPLKSERGSTHTIVIVAVDVTEKVKSKREFEAAYDQARLSKEAAQLGTFDMDLVNNTLEWDERCRTLFGISHNEPVTYEEDFVKGLHPDDRERILAVINNVMIRSVSNGDYDVEYRTVGADDKKVRWIRAKGKAYFNEKDQPVRFIGSVLDITEQKENEVRLIESAEKHARLAAIVNTTDDVIISKTLGGIITSWNSAAERLFGYTGEEAIGKHISLIIPESHQEEETFIISQIKQGEKIEHFETIRVAKNGSKVPISLTVSPIVDTNGVIIGASKIARDISMQQAAAKTARQYTKRLEIINNMSQIVSGELDLNKLLQKITDATTELTGAKFGAFFYNTVDEKGESFLLYTLSGAPREAFEKFGMPRNTAIFHPTFSGQGVVRADDITKDPRYGKNNPHFGMPKGHLPVVSYLAVPVVSRSGNVIGGLFFGHPEPARFTREHESLVISIAAQSALGIDNAKLFEEVTTLNEKKDEFIGLASHELKTPLTSIYGYLQILSRMKNDPQSQKFVDKAVQQVGKLTTLVNDLLDVSKIEAGKLQMIVEDFDIKLVIEDTIELTKLTTDKYEISFDAEVKSCYVKADSRRIEQVLINLLTNAIKYSPGENRVEVFLACTDTNVKVSVKDYGPGIPDDKLTQIFSRFYRIEDTNPNISGLGIGLYLSHEIISRHNGELWVESEPGKGAMFSFTLPV